MTKKKVVITGMGAITPIGNNIEEFWQGLISGRNGVQKITHFDAKDHMTKFAAEVKDFHAEDHMKRKEIKRMDRFTQFSVAASAMALKDSKLDIDSTNQDRIGCIIGSCMGGVSTLEEQFQRYSNRGAASLSPYFIPKILIDLAAGQVAIKFGLKGPNYAAVSACASAIHSIGSAFHLIQRGDADAMVCGGAEAAICKTIVAGLNSLKALSTLNEDYEHASRPFDKMRDGFVIGEGAGILILEELEHAKKRNARIVAEIGGVGYTDDAFHITAPAEGGDGFAKAMTNALKDAGLGCDHIDYINAHGTSTQFNDRNETLAIKKVFGAHTRNLSVSSTKSMTGHLIGAAGGIETVATVLALQHSLIPPTINYQVPDEECDLDYVPNKPQKKGIGAAMCNSFGFGGHNSCLLVKKFE